jgi:glycosyltransferase involved in cell wall biosynthesis
MRILHIIPTLQKGGAERLVIDIVRALDGNPAIKVALVLFHDVIQYPVEDIRHLIHVIPANISLSLKAKNKKNVAILQELIDELQPNIIHTHLFEAELVSRSIDYPLAKWFSHCHDNMVQFKKLTDYKKPTKQALTNAYEKKYLFKGYKKNKGTHFIAISNDAYTYFKSRIKNYPITLLHNAVDYNHFYTPLKNKERTNNTIRLINIGSFVPKKNQAFLIKVVELLVQKKYAVHLDLLGDGVLRKTLVEEVKVKGLSKHITFHGNVFDVPKYLHQSAIYLHSATYEPLGLVLLEAMSAGLPVVCLDGKGNRDLIEQGKNGFIFQEQDPSIFATCIIELWENKSQYHEMSSYAQNSASKYDIVTYVDRLLEIYAKEFISNSTNSP